MHPLAIESTCTYTTVMAKFWLWLQPFFWQKSLHPFKLGSAAASKNRFTCPRLPLRSLPINSPGSSMWVFLSRRFKRWVPVSNFNMGVPGFNASRDPPCHRGVSRSLHLDYHYAVSGCASWGFDMRVSVLNFNVGVPAFNASRARTPLSSRTCPINSSGLSIWGFRLCKGCPDIHPRARSHESRRHSKTKG